MNTPKKQKVVTRGSRESLKIIMQKEIENLPETLEKLEPKVRLNIICKLMPFIFPKIESVHVSDGEPEAW